VANSSYTAEGPLQLNTIAYMYLVLDEFSSNYPNSFIVPLTKSYLSKSILARISIDSTLSSFGSISVFSKAHGNLLSDLRSYGGKTDIQKVQVQLVDEWGSQIDLNMDFSFSLRLDYE